LTVRLEKPPQPEDKTLQSSVHGGGRGLTPQLVDKPVRGDHLTGPEEQHSKQQPSATSGQRHQPPVVEDLGRSQDAKLHPALLPRQPYQGVPSPPWRN
jgi:hypothetical protein